MKLVVCLDENNGIKFFGKRQSQDELQRKNLFELIGNLKLFMICIRILNLILKLSMKILKL